MYWHILWTAYPVPVPNRQRNTIDGLYKFYGVLKTNEIKYEISQPLKAKAYTSKIKPDRPILNPLLVENDIKRLAIANGDRIAGDLPIISILVMSDRVELLTRFDGDNLLQKIARLKSRSATLLSFSSETEGGKHTWSKGIWYGKSTDKRFVQFVRDRITGFNNN